MSASASSVRPLVWVTAGAVMWATVHFYYGEAQAQNAVLNGMGGFPPNFPPLPAAFSTGSPHHTPMGTYGASNARSDPSTGSAVMVSQHLHPALSGLKSPPAPIEGSTTGIGTLPPQRENGTAPTPPCMEAAALGLPSDQAVRCYGGYIASLNYERRIPNWVVEVLNYSRLRPSGGLNSSTASSASRESAGSSSTAKTEKKSSKVKKEEDCVEIKRKEEEEEEDVEAHHGISRQHSSFFADPTVEDVFRVSPRVYSDSGYWGISRGHLAPAQFHKASQDEMNATFNMNANIVPQDMAFNALDWFRLEVLTMRIARALQQGTQEKKKGAVKPYADPEARLYVATGPAFVPTRNKDGQLQVVYDVLESKKPEQMVAVPTHLYKVLVAERRETASASPQYSAAAFLLPNHAIAEERPLSEYQVPISSLESLTGLRFFPAVNAAALPNLCNRFRCDAKGSALFNSKYRPIAQLRSATSVPELRQRFHKIVEEHTKEKGGKSSLDASIEKEYKKRLEVLVAKSVQPVD